MPPQDQQKQRQGQFAQKVEQSLGIIPGTKLWSPFPFAGLNLNDSPPAIDDKEFSYMENFVRLGNGYLRTQWDVGSALFTATSAGTILPYFFWYNIGAIDYVAVFVTDGTAIQVQQSNGAITTISGQGNTFYRNGGNRPVCSQSGTQYLIIANNNTPNDYWLWDGSLLYGAGTVSPFINITSGGENYNTTPTITAFGGTGSGATFAATVAGGSITNITVTDPGSGYSVGDIVQLLFSGGGSDTSAQLQANLASGAVAAISISAPGGSYSTAPSISFSGGGGGSGAAATASISGPVSGVSVGSGGTGYTSVPTVALTGGGGTGATAHATLSSTSVATVVVDEGGSGYTSAPTVVFTGGGGTGADATAAVDLGVTAIIVTSGGSGYTSAPTVVFSGGGGSGATAAALLNSSGVASVTVLNGGTGFTSAPLLQFEGGGGAGATAIALLTGTSIASINITAGGTGFFNPPTITISAPASGVTTTATAAVDNGAVISVTITNAGSGYTGVPEITITPNALDTLAAGAGLVAVLAATSIGSVQVTSVGGGYTTAPAVLVEAGANHCAYATVDMMPFGVSGSSIETFNSRVWICDPFQGTSIPTGGDFVVSAGDSLTDFATSDGGVIFTNSDRFLRKQYVGVRQSNGYLYFFGDSSISVVSNINTTGDPSTTTFNYLNVDPQVGMGWRDSIQDFGRTIIFGSRLGVWGLYGGAATPVGEKLDRLWNNAVFPPAAGALQPSSAVATFFNKKYYLFLFTASDPETGELRNIMAAWDTKTWSIMSQTPALTFIGTQEVNSQPLAWGTDGTSIYPLFNQPSSSLVKRLTTKYYGTDSLLILKDFFNLYLQGQDLSIGLSGIDLTVDLIASGIAIQPSTNPHFDAQSVVSTTWNSANYPDFLLDQPNFNAPPPYFPVWGNGSGGFSFSTLAAQFRTTSPDFALSNLLLAYVDNTAYQ